MEERYKKADLDKNGYISAREYVRLRISEYEEIIKEYKDMQNTFLIVLRESNYKNMIRAR